MRRASTVPVLVIVLATATAACSSSTTNENPSKADALQKYTFPSECSKWSECDPDGFAANHSGGAAGCVDDDFAAISKILGSDVLAQRSPCTQSQLEHCSMTYATATCPSQGEIKAGNYLPPSPDPSCGTCGWHQ